MISRACGKSRRLADMVEMIMADADDRDLLGPDADPGELVDDASRASAAVIAGVAVRWPTRAAGRPVSQSM